MSRCAHSVMTILLLFQTATSVRGRAGLGTYSRFGLGVLLSGKKTLSAKNSGGNKDDSVSAGGNCSHWIWSLLLSNEYLCLDNLN